MRPVVVCPFYVRDSVRNKVKRYKQPYISCERMKMRFADDESLLGYSAVYCESECNWKECEVAKLTWELYEKGLLK